MSSPKLAALFGFLVWLFAFVVSVLIFPLHETERPLFESIMPVALALATVTLAALYFRRVRTAFLREGVILGLLWLAINVVIDLLLFIWGPLKMTPGDYVKDIGLTYLMIPIITAGMGYVLARARTGGE
jgi:hypothetical protein